MNGIATGVMGSSVRRWMALRPMLFSLLLSVVTNGGHTVAAEVDGRPEALARVRRLVADRRPVRVVVYGDSISEVKQGWNGGATSPAANWGAVLVKRLGELHPGSSFDIQHFAIGGQNSSEGLDRLDGLAPLAPDLVLVAFGANDCCHHFLEPDETKVALTKLCTEIRKRHGADVLLVGTAGDNPLKPFFRHLDETLAAQRQAAADAAVPFVDTRSAILAATENGKRWAEFHFNAENCHPTDQGHVVWAEAVLAAIRRADTASETTLLAAEIHPHLGRPTVILDGKPVSLAAYSPAAGWNRELFQREMDHFANRKLDCFFINLGQAKAPDGDWSTTPLWIGDDVTATPAAPFKLPPDEQAETILRTHPDATLIVRFGLHEPMSWRTKHPEQLFVDEDGTTFPVPSLASAAYWDAAALYAAAAIEYSEARPWAHRIIGYADFLRMEGTHEPLIRRSLFDHGPAMTARWRRWLEAKYGTVERLREAHGDKTISFDSAAVPRDRLRGPAAEVAGIPYWQAGVANAPLRDYLALQRDLYHEGFRKVAAASAAALERLGRRRFLVYDSHKSVMLGWDNGGFFDKQVSWRHAYPELMAGSGNLAVASLFAGVGIDGLITPHDYQARGVGGVFEPEGVADSAVLRGKLMLCEMDTRTWAGTDPIAPARDAAEFAAITWRNVATALTRGFTPYWMDVYQDWFAPPELQPIIDRQAEVLGESVTWPHDTVPGIAMIIDDEAVLETNGDGRFLNEAVLWEWKTGLARAGVPVRIYLFDDLALPNFPTHGVFYFPNLFRIDAARRRLLEEKVLRDGHVVVWGPGTGISDGLTIGTEAAAAVTGFSFDLLPVNDHRRTLLVDTSHPLTKGLSPATVLGGPLAYGPVLLPTDGHALGHAWTKLGRNLAGLAVKERTAADGSTWTSVFTSTPGLPAGFWRNAARHARAHVWCETDEIVLADTSLVAIHSATGGPRTILLPRDCDVVDVVTGKPVATRARTIEIEMKAPETRVFRMLPGSR